jgi:uncharacterized protein
LFGLFGVILSMATNLSKVPGTKHANRLAREKSPYLLQHQHNPVDWYPWGEEAFAKARRENKPIFLSIGYSTCHWCHVMERESFETESVATLLNESFISIKVDREERPDVDKIYMTFVQATTGQGGWPLSAFLTPELKPFYGGTYFPPDNRYGRPGFKQLLIQLQELWGTRQADLVKSASEMHSRLREASENAAPGCIPLAPEALQHAAQVFKQAYDPVHGGFGGAPKFPQPSQPQFLLRYAHRFGDTEAIQMVLTTCDHMAAGGIHDQLGGGFSRYSVDAQWLVPHFEKMLYDNAQLTQLYLDAYLVSGEARHAEVIRRILGYVLRDMTHPEGGFYSAEDADSEGHEGKFYCWEYDELSKLLTPEEFNVAIPYFGITRQGNFIDHSHPTPLAGQNVLSLARPEVAPADRELLASAIGKMQAARKQRVRPHLDDKVLASWNGLMLGAVARAYAILRDDTYRVAAERNLEFLRSRLWDPDKRVLYHRWRDGERDHAQLLESYACLLLGVLDLYEATLQPEHLEFAITLAESMFEKFYDGENGGFWQSGPEANDLILRIKEDYDGAEPSGNSVAVLGLLRLGKITGREAFTKAAERTLHLFAERLTRLPQAVPFLLQALDFSLQEPTRLVVAGPAGTPATNALLHAAHSVYAPDKVVFGVTGPVEEFARSLPTAEEPVAYVCTGTECQAPTSNPAKLQQMLLKD